MSELVVVFCLVLSVAGLVATVVTVIGVGADLLAMNSHDADRYSQKQP